MNLWLTTPPLGSSRLGTWQQIPHGHKSPHGLLGSPSTSAGSQFRSLSWCHRGSETQRPRVTLNPLVKQLGNSGGKDSNLRSPSGEVQGAECRGEAVWTGAEQAELKLNAATNTAKHDLREAQITKPGRTQNWLSNQAAITVSFYYLTGPTINILTTINTKRPQLVPGEVQSGY